MSRPWVGGIAGGPEGCYSIALSGGYEDDIDFFADWKSRWHTERVVIAATFEGEAQAVSEVGREGQRWRPICAGRRIDDVQASEECDRGLFLAFRGGLYPDVEVGEKERRRHVEDGHHDCLCYANDAVSPSCEPSTQDLKSTHRDEAACRARRFAVVCAFSCYRRAAWRLR